MTKVDIASHLKGVSRAVAIEVAYLVGHQIAHPKFSLLTADIPNDALDDVQRTSAANLAATLLGAFEIDNGRTVDKFSQRDRDVIGRKLRGFVRENVIDQSSVARANAAAFLENIAA